MDGAETLGTKKSSLLRRRLTFALGLALSTIIVYVLVAYLLVPLLWSRYAKRHPALENLPDISYTHDHHPGDPINLALVGTEDEVNAIMRAAGWHVADPLGLKSDVKIAADTVLDRPYADAPVSSLYLWSRKED